MFYYIVIAVVLFILLSSVVMGVWLNKKELHVVDMLIRKEGLSIPERKLEWSALYIWLDRLVGRSGKDGVKATDPFYNYVPHFYRIKINIALSKKYNSSFFNGLLMAYIPGWRYRFLKKKAGV